MYVEPEAWCIHLGGRARFLLIWGTVRRLARRLPSMPMRDFAVLSTGFQGRRHAAARAVAALALLVCAPIGAFAEARTAAAERRAADPVVGAPSAAGGTYIAAQAVRRLTVGEADERRPVRLDAQITYVDPDWELLFVQDATAGIFVYPRGPLTDYHAGQRVIVEGVTVAGDFAPSIGEAKVTPVGTAAPLVAVRPDAALLQRGEYDSQWIELEGIVRAVRFPVKNGHLGFDLLVDGRRVLAQFPGPWERPLPSALVDAKVRIRAVCGSTFNQYRQFVAVQLYLQSPEQLEVIEPAVPAAALPRRHLDDLLRFTSVVGDQHRSRVGGVVTLVDGRRLFLRDDTGAAMIRLAAPASHLAVGDEVEVTGFVATGTYGPMLEDGEVSRLTAGRPAMPRREDVDRLAMGFADSDLVQVEARLIETVFVSDEQSLVLMARGRTFRAHLRGPMAAWPRVPVVGSVVRLVGVSEASINREADPIDASTFSLLLRTPADVIVLQSPSWWTAERAGALLAVLASVGLVVTGWAGVLRRRVRAQTQIIRQRLQQEIDLQSRFRDLFDNANDLVFIADLHGRLTSINRAGERVTGYPRHEAQTMFLSDLVPAEQRERVQRAIGEVLQGRRSGTFEADVLTRSGARVTLEFDARPFEEHGAVAGLQAIARDVTARKRTETELQRARDAAEATSRAKSEFVANMSHEIRTPMNGILGMTEVLLQGSVSDEQRQYLEMIRSSGDSLLHVVNDVLDFSKVEAGRLELSPTTTDLREHLADTLQHVAVSARQKGIELACRVTPAVPGHVVIDPVRLRQIVLNLVNNAIKFTDAGAVVVEADAVDVPGPHREDRVQLVLRVTDSGVGISPDKHRLIFEAFTQVDGSTSRRHGGTGLGLAICASLARLMGGTIEVASEPGRGSTFSLTMPVDVAPTTRTTPPFSGQALVIDGHDVSRQALSESLAGLGFTCILAADVDAGLAALAQLAEPPALIAIGTDVPGAGDPGLPRVLETRAPGARVLALALAPQHDDRRIARQLGAFSCLPRPAAPEALARGVREALGLVPPHESANEAPAAASRPLEILLVEDNPVNQRVAERMLVARGHAVRVAGNGREALAMLDDWRPHVVLMDVQMPVMNGIEATLAIRAAEGASGPRLPIVAMTAHALDGDRQRCLMAGMDGYLTKPVNARTLIDAVERFGETRMSTPSQDDPARTAPPPAPDTAEPVIDRTAALERVDGDTELLSEIVDLFLSDIDALTDEIRQAVTASDPTRVMRSAHRLKGSVATLAARRATAAALRLENIGRSGDLADATAAFAALEAEVGLLPPALRALVAETSASN